MISVLKSGRTDQILVIDKGFFVRNGIGNSSIFHAFLETYHINLSPWELSEKKEEGVPKVMK